MVSDLKLSLVNYGKVLTGAINNRSDQISLPISFFVSHSISVTDDLFTMEREGKGRGVGGMQKSNEKAKFAKPQCSFS